MRAILLTIAIIFIRTICYTQTISTLGTPHVQNFTKTQYKAGNQNWGIVQGSDGIIYTANNNGLLIFDGSYWEIKTLENKKHLRSVAISPINGDIYIGGKEEFGYFYKANGTLKYKNLSKLINADIIQNDEIWKIMFIDNSVIFQSFSKLYIFQKNKIEIQHGYGEPFLFTHQVNKNIWIEKIPSGLHSWSINNFSPLNNKLTEVLTILPLNNNQNLVGTAKNGLYILSNNGKIDKWNLNPKIDDKLKEAQINNGLKINNNTFAFGTIKNGIFIIDNKGNFLQHIHKRNGLQNNTVLSLTLDKQGNIWAGLDNGIDRIEINSPFYYYKDFFGELGTVYAIKIFNDKIYLGTNQGLFYSEWTNGNELEKIKLNFIEGSHGQVWTLDIFNNQLICGHNDGTFIINNNKLNKISNWTGGWINKQTYPASNIFLQGNYTGLAAFENSINGWRLKEKFEIPKHAVLDLIKKENTSYWIITNNSIKLVRFSPDYDSIELIKEYSFKKDFSDIQFIKTFLIENNPLFITDKGIYIYDNVLSKFKSYEELDKKLGSFAKSKQVNFITENNYILAHNGKFAKLSVSEGQIKIDSSSYEELENIVMKNHEIVEPYKQKLIFGLDNGIAIYDTLNYKRSPITKPIIRGFQYLNSTQENLHAVHDKVNIPNTNNSIRILFSSPWFSSTPVKYQYILEGYNSQWSVPSETSFIDFTSLKWGNYTFKLKAISSEGYSSEITSLQFKILAPWYYSWQAILLYFFILIILLFTGRTLILIKIKRDKKLISDKIRLQQEEIFKMETEQNEKKLMALKNEQLSQELELKSRELSNAATNILYKNELLNNLHEELLNIKDKEGKKLTSDQLQKVNKLINNAKSDERDWDIFEKSFNESHENFFKKLKVKYPSLSPNDLKLCAYLRLNMSSKDIASLINISIRGVEIRRYRLRKKFNLNIDKNLNEFLIEL